MEGRRRKMWNLNSSTGWPRVEASDYNVLLVTLKNSGPSNSKFEKKMLDERVRSELTALGAGNAIEDDEKGENDLVLMVKKDFPDPKSFILGIASQFQLGEAVSVYERQYIGPGEFVDKLL